MEKEGNFVKDSILVSLAQVLKLVFSLVRNKLIATYMGSSGIGLWSYVQSLLDLCQNISILGTDKSGVKNIAEDNQEKYKNVVALRLVILISTLVTSFLLYIFLTSKLTLPSEIDSPISKILLCIYVILNTNAMAITFVLNGYRDLSNLIRMQLSFYVISFLVSTFLIITLSKENIVFIFLFQGVSHIVIASVFLKKQKDRQMYSFEEIKKNSIKIVKGGQVFFIPAILMSAVDFAIRVYIENKYNIEQLGLYQASWSITNLYVTVFLTTVTTVMFPKLCEASNNSNRIKIINDQILFGMVVSLPVVFFILVFSDSILSILYNSNFVTADKIVTWQMMGVVLKLSAFPLGYNLVTNGRNKEYIFSQISFSIIYLITVISISEYYGFESLGIAYFLSYLVYFILIFITNKRYTGYHSNRNIKTMMFLTYSGAAFTIIMKYLQINWEISRLMVFAFVVVYSIFYFYKHYVKK